MGNFKPISKRSKRDRSGISLTLGVDGRMYLSRGLRQLLEHNDKQSYYLFYDEDGERIGLSEKRPDENIEPFTFNKKGEGNVVNLVEDCEIQIPGKPLLWLYEGKENGILAFFKKGRIKSSFKQQRNGNLERV